MLIVRDIRFEIKRIGSESFVPAPGWMTILFESVVEMVDKIFSKNACIKVRL